MTSAAMRRNTPKETVETPLSIAGLATRLGVTRQRVYNMIYRGEVKAEQMRGGLVIAPAEAERVLDAAIHIDTGKGSRPRLVFDFI